MNEMYKECPNKCWVVNYVLDTKHINNYKIEYAYKNDSGFDLRADIKEQIVLKPLERVKIPTGFYIELPQFSEGQVRPRSGNAFLYGLSVLNTPGTIDSDYRGEICVILVNLSNDEIEITPNMKVAQFVISPVFKETDLSLNRVYELSDSERGDKGFNSSGNNK